MLSPLRQRMIDDMTVSNLSAQTQASHVQYVSQLARFFRRSPEKLGVEDIRTFLLYLANEKGLSPSARNLVTADRLVGRIRVAGLSRVRWRLAAEFLVGGMVHAEAEQQGLFMRLSTRRPIAIPEPIRRWHGG